MKIFSSGGGVQSTACLILSAQGRIDYPIHVFANVGAKAENPETIVYVEQVLKPYAAKYGIEWVEVCKRDKAGNPVDLYDHLMRPIRSIDIPVRMAGSGAPGNRNCTQGWKIEVISKYLLNLAYSSNPGLKDLVKKITLDLRSKALNLAGVAAVSDLSNEQRASLKQQIFAATSKAFASSNNPIVLGKGISTDEISRARSASGFAHYAAEHPLIDLELSRSDCIRIILEAGLPLSPKSSCWFCPEKRLSYWQEMKRDQPDLFAASVDLEKVLSDRRKSLGKDAVYLTSRGATRGATLDQVVSDQLDLFEDWGLGNCESGFCMV